MITLFTGSDYTARQRAIEQQKKQWAKAGHEVLSFFADESSAEDIINALSHKTLFGDTYAYILHGCVDHADILSVLSGQPDTLAICIEDATTAAQIKIATKILGAGMIEVKKFPKGRENDTAIFNLANDIRTRNPKNLWLTYQSLLADGYTVHQMMGVAWWQIKSMMLVQASPTVHGLKPFVAGKAQDALKKYPKKDLSKISKGLLDVYHYGHTDGSLENRFEEFLLAIAK